MNNSALRISEASILALHSLVMISQADENKLESVKNISETLNVSKNHLSKVLQRLVKANIIASCKGCGGGFYLVKDAKDITFLEIYEIIDGKLAPEDCLLSGKEGVSLEECCCAECIMGGFLKSINKQTRDFFSKTSLADFKNKKTFKSLS